MKDVVCLFLDPKRVREIQDRMRIPDIRKRHRERKEEQRVREKKSRRVAAELKRKKKLVAERGYKKFEFYIQPEDIENLLAYKDEKGLSWPALMRDFDYRLRDR